MALLINGDIQHSAMGVPAIQHASGDPLNFSPYCVEKIFDYRSGKYPIVDVYLHYVPDYYIIIVLYRSLKIPSSISKTTRETYLQRL